MSDTYTMPAHGWTCFFCGETFKKYGAARDHFGAEPFATAACQIKVGDERGLVMELRKAEGERNHLRETALFLWKLLDDIDTASDMAKNDNVGYRAFVEKTQSRRFEVGTVSADAQTVAFPPQADHERTG